MSADLLLATRATTTQPAHFSDLARYVVTATANANAFMDIDQRLPATSAVYVRHFTTEFDPERFGAGVNCSRYSFDHGPVIAATILSKSDHDGSPRALLPEGNRGVPPCHYLVEFVGVGSGRPFIHAAGALVSHALEENHAHESQFKHMLMGYDWEQFTMPSSGEIPQGNSRLVVDSIKHTTWTDTPLLERLA